MKLKLFVLFVMAFGSKESKTVAGDDTARGDFEEIKAEKSILVKIEEDEYVKKQISQYIGVSYIKSKSKWRAERWSKHRNKPVYNGHYDTEELAVLASDTLARKLIDNGEQNHKLNFPDDNIEVFMEKKNSSQYIGVSYHKGNSKWVVRRWSKIENKHVYNGCYNTPEAAVHASDTLARELTENGEQGHKLNLPDDETKLHGYKKRSASKYFGLSYDKNRSKWLVRRWSKTEKKRVHNGHYDTEELAAHASDTLAKKLMENGEQGHKLNFPDDETEHKTKRKRLEDLGILSD